MKVYVIDRFEGDYAVCENTEQEYALFLISRLPPDAKEGSVLRVDENNTIVVDFEETEARRSRILEKQNRLFED